MSNLDPQTVRGFGVEWERFDQSALSSAELRRQFDAYFAVFPWDALPPNAEGFDVGCGSGRWARFVAERVGRLHLVDASTEALDVARRNLAGRDNCIFHHASVDAVPLADGSADFGYSLGVLHHVPDTAEGIKACVRKLKRGAPLLLYLYYALENRSSWYRALWRASDRVRCAVAGMPDRGRLLAADLLAASVYWPCARTARLVERFGGPAEALPLFAYRNSSFYTMRTDALDRFGTKLERRFTAERIREMMLSAGLERIHFSPEPPYWCAVGYRA
jgi:ubiquinone/menaquinone biosynthesis C-methylase UbiE